MDEVFGANACAGEIAAVNVMLCSASANPVMFNSTLSFGDAVSSGTASPSMLILYLACVAFPRILIPLPETFN